MAKVSVNSNPKTNHSVSVLSWFPLLLGSHLVTTWARGSWSIHAATHILAGKLIFAEEGEPGENSSDSDWDQPITAHVRAQDRTRVVGVGGEAHSPGFTSIYQDVT